MKSQLIGHIVMAIDLLNDCGWGDHARWLSEIKCMIDNSDQDSERFYELLDELDGVLTGMGSFSDLPLRDNSGLRSELEFRKIQWDLVDKIGNTIEKLKANAPNKNRKNRA